MSTCRLLLIRHGQTLGNLDGSQVMLGRTDFPLTVEGVRQARAVARRLGSYCFDAVYSSPLQRAAATAREVVALHHVPLHWCPALQEIDCGHADGLDVETAKRRFPVPWKVNDRQHDPDFRWPGGESYRELRRRVLAACDQITDRHHGSAVVVVTHAGVISQILGSLTGLSAAAWRPLRPDHCTVTTVEWPPRPVGDEEADERAVADAADGAGADRAGVPLGAVLGQ